MAEKARGFARDQAQVLDAVLADIIELLDGQAAGKGENENT
jgi:hypothetical protein